jgi:ABC-type transport system involved in multi-copper enzyme maturation permease subunit
MLRLVVDEARKLRGSWFLVGLLVGTSLAPFLAVSGAWSNAVHDPKNLFDFEAVLSQFFFDAVLIFHPLTFGTLAAFVLQREYQNRTLQALLLVPWSRSDLLTAKILFLGAVSLGFVAYALGLTLVLGVLAGAADFSWNQVVTSGLPIFVSWFVGVPCLVTVLLVAMVSRNLMAAVAFCLAALFVGVATATLGDAAFFNPWSFPFVLGAGDQILLNQAMDPSLVPRTWAAFVAFFGAAFVGAYWLFERTNAD